MRHSYKVEERGAVPLPRTMCQKYVPVVQLEKTPPCEGGNRGFKSLQAHHDGERRPQGFLSGETDIRT